MLDIATLAGDAMLALSSLGAGYAARRTRKNAKAIKRFTDADLNDKIQSAVVDVLASEEGQHLRAVVRSLMHHHRMDADRTEW